VPCSKHWRDHLAALPKNKKGYPSTGFWEQAARRVVGVAIEGTARLSSDQLGLRQRYHGGVIKARNHKYLTIPICAEAYGTKVADWGIENLVLVITWNARFFALWLPTSEDKKIFKRKMKLTTRAENTTRKVGQLMSAFEEAATERSYSPKKPDVILLNRGGSGMSTSRAEKHSNLKFLFVLVESVDQAANPNVVPGDLAEVALEAILEGSK
jgi:hypothetical protein